MKRSYVVELIPVSSSLLIDKSFSITFISKIASLILQIVLDLLLNIQIVEVLHNFKQAICILEQSFTVDRMAARCAQVEIEEPKVAASFPASVLFFGVIVEQLLEWYPQERGGRDVVWEWWKIWESVAWWRWWMVGVRHVCAMLCGKLYPGCEYVGRNKSAGNIVLLVAIVEEYEAIAAVVVDLAG
jgi:hypothetical protein